MITVGDDHFVKLCNIDNFSEINSFEIQNPTHSIILNVSLMQQEFKNIYLKNVYFYQYIHFFTSDIDLNNCLVNCSNNGIFFTIVKIDILNVYVLKVLLDHLARQTKELALQILVITFIKENTIN